MVVINPGGPYYETLGATYPPTGSPDVATAQMLGYLQGFATKYAE